MVRRTSHHFAFLMWRLKGISDISEGIGAELEGKTGVGEGAERNPKIPGSEFLGRTTCSPGKGHSSHGLQERNNSEL